MKIDRRDGTQQRAVLTGMMVSDAVCGAVAAKWPDPEGLFESRWSNLVGGWAVAFYRKYRRAPGKNLTSIFDRWAGEGKKDKDVVKHVETFLAGLSEEYAARRKAVQADYLIDVAGHYFTDVLLRKAHAEAGALLENGQPEQAAEKMAGARKIDLAGGQGIDVLEDEAALDRCFERKAAPLVTFPGAAGAFYGNEFGRDCFVSFEGPEKSGKSHVLQDVGWRAILQGRKVAIFQAGDMSQEQFLMRLAVRATRRPERPVPYDYPISLEPPGVDGKMAHPVLKRGEPAAGLSAGAAKLAFKRVRDKLRAKTKSKDPPFKLYTCPARGISVTGIEGVLAVWEAQTGWVADVIIIDYADILAPVNGTADTRDQINMTWILMRAMSSRRHCLVVTATQTNTKSYNAERIDMDNFSEDKRKRGHITATYGINMTDAERELGLSRINCIRSRANKFDPRKDLHCAGSLALAAPMMFSVF